jgi:hypothetical protein
LGFDAQGVIVNRPDTHGSQALDWTDICQRAAKVNDLFLYRPFLFMKIISY